MNIALVTSRAAHLAAFRAGLENRNARIEGFSDAWSLLQAARTRTWNLVIVDGLRVPFHAFLGDLMEINASLNTAVITDLNPEAFHEAAEGLGILCALPSSPTALDAEPLLAKLLAVGGLDPALEAAQARLNEARFRLHPHCVVCWDRHPFGLQVDYRVTSLHTVEGSFGCGKSYEGYEGIVHGGIVSSLLDGAMASCILALGHEAYTVDLQIRFRGPVRTALPATIRGAWIRKAGPLHFLNATLEQDGKTCASARAKFMEGTPGAPSSPLPISADVRHLLSHARKRLI